MAHAAGAHSHGGEIVRAASAADPALLGTLVHTAGYLVVAALIALIVYDFLGVRLLRRAWINVNLIWAVALVATGLLTPLL